MAKKQTRAVQVIGALIVVAAVFTAYAALNNSNYITGRVAGCDKTQSDASVLIKTAIADFLSSDAPAATSADINDMIGTYVSAGGSSGDWGGVFNVVGASTATEIINDCLDGAVLVPNGECHPTQAKKCVDGAIVASAQECCVASSSTVPGWVDTNGQLPGCECYKTQASETSCSDNVDNDCDGVTDAIDSNCASGSSGVVSTGEPVAVWARNPSAGTGLSNDYSRSVAVDPSGNIYLVGITTAGLGVPNITFSPGVSTGNDGDFFLVKYDSSGNALWAREAQKGTGSTANEQRGTGATLASLTTDGQGNVYMVGDTAAKNTVFGPGVNMTILNNALFFVVKYDSAGNALWARGPANDTGTSTSVIAQMNAIAVDASGNVFAGGKTAYGNISFGQGVNLTGRAYYDFFVVKYDSSGNPLWARGPAAGSGKALELIGSVFADASGNVYATGSFTGNVGATLDFGSGNVISSRGGMEPFMVKYDSSGNALWAMNPGLGKSGALNISVSFVAFDKTGNVYVEGRDNITSKLFLMKYDPSGNVLWSGVPGEAAVSGTFIGGSSFVDASGNFYMAGTYNGTSVSFGPGVSLAKPGNSANEMFLAKYNSTGSALWAINATYTDAGWWHVAGPSMVVDGSGNIYLAGANAADMVFGPGVSTTFRGDAGAYINDFFLAKYAQT